MNKTAKVLLYVLWATAWMVVAVPIFIITMGGLLVWLGPPKVVIG